MGGFERLVWSSTHPLDLSFAHEKPRLAWPGGGFNLEVIRWFFSVPSIARQIATFYEDCREL